MHFSNKSDPTFKLQLSASQASIESATTYFGKKFRNSLCKQLTFWQLTFCTFCNSLFATHFLQLTSLKMHSSTNLMHVSLCILTAT